MTSPFPLKLTLITVHYRTEESVLNLWKSLEKFPPSISWEFILVDNNSGEKKHQRIKEILESSHHGHFIGLSENRGFGEGNMEGVRFAQGEIICFINPDIEVTKGVLDTLLSVLESNPKNGIVTPFLQTKDSKPLPNTWRFPSIFSLLKKRLTKLPHIHPTQTKPFPVDWIQGSFLMMRKEFFTSVLKGFDTRFFLFLEDTDLCRRTWEAGYRVLQVPTVRAFHEQKRLSGEGLVASMQKRTFWIHVSSVWKYFWKWKGKKTPKVF